MKTHILLSMALNLIVSANFAYSQSPDTSVEEVISNGVQSFDAQLTGAKGNGCESTTSDASIAEQQSPILQCNDYSEKFKRNPPVGFKCRTSTNVVLERIEYKGLGTVVWKTPGNVIIGDELPGDYTYEEAEKACPAGTRIPNVSEYEALEINYRFFSEVSPRLVNKKVPSKYFYTMNEGDKEARSMLCYKHSIENRKDQLRVTGSIFEDRETNCSKVRCIKGNIKMSEKALKNYRKK